MSGPFGSCSFLFFPVLLVGGVICLRDPYRRARVSGKPRQGRIKVNDIRTKFGFKTFSTTWPHIEDLPFPKKHESEVGVSTDRTGLQRKATLGNHATESITYCETETTYTGLTVTHDANNEYAEAPAIRYNMMKNLS